MLLFFISLILVESMYYQIVCGIIIIVDKNNLINISVAYLSKFRKVFDFHS